MRQLTVPVFLLCLCVTAVSQTASSDEALLAKTRALYDAPFTRNLISFDCAVQFDWQKHFREIIKAVPPSIEPAIEHLQSIQHRVFVDRSGAVTSAIPKAPDLSGIAHAADLEQALNAMVSGGLDAWLPFSTNVILPLGPTKYKFEKTSPGYKLTMNGPGMNATLLLAEDMRLTSAVSQSPQPMRFDTQFEAGPDGFLLNSVKTANTTDATTNRESTFSYTYQTVQGFELPSQITVAPSTTPEVWHYTLTGCKVMTGITIKVEPPNQ